jgi:hypothetical protein
LADHWASTPKVVGSIPTAVAGHIFQAHPVWIYTQSNITNIIFTWVHNTNTGKKILLLMSFNSEVSYTTVRCPLNGILPIFSNYKLESFCIYCEVHIRSFTYLSFQNTVTTWTVLRTVNVC